MRRVAALLRGVNVGGNRKLPMAELTAFVTGLGHGEAKTLLASGNIVFTADEDAAALEMKLEAAAKVQLGLDTTILVRDAADLDALIANAPFAEARSVRPNHVVAVFHRTAPDPALIERLVATHDGPETMAIVGRELVIDYPAGIGTSTLDRSMAKLKFPTRATARNWNTVLKLRAMLD